MQVIYLVWGGQCRLLCFYFRGYTGILACLLPSLEGPFPGRKLAGLFSKQLKRLVALLALGSADVG